MAVEGVLRQASLEDSGAGPKLSSFRPESLSSLLRNR